MRTPWIAIVLSGFILVETDNGAGMPHREIYSYEEHPTMTRQMRPESGSSDSIENFTGTSLMPGLLYVVSRD